MMRLFVIMGLLGALILQPLPVAAENAGNTGDDTAAEPGFAALTPAAELARFMRVIRGGKNPAFSADRRTLVVAVEDGVRLDIEVGCPPTDIYPGWKLVTHVKGDRPKAIAYTDPVLLGSKTGLWQIGVTPHSRPGIRFRGILWCARYEGSDVKQHIVLTLEMHVVAPVDESDGVGSYTSISADSVPAWLDLADPSPEDEDDESDDTPRKQPVAVLEPKMGAIVPWSGAGAGPMGGVTARWLPDRNRWVNVQLTALVGSTPASMDNPFPGRTGRVVFERFTTVVVGGAGVSWNITNAAALTLDAGLGFHDARVGRRKVDGGSISAERVTDLGFVWGPGAHFGTRTLRGGLQALFVHMRNSGDGILPAATFAWQF